MDLIAHSLKHCRYCVNLHQSTNWFINQAIHTICKSLWWGTILNILNEAMYIDDDLTYEDLILEHMKRDKAKLLTIAGVKQKFFPWLKLFQKYRLYHLYYNTRETGILFFLDNLIFVILIPRAKNNAWLLQPSAWSAGYREWDRLYADSNVTCIRPNPFLKSRVTLIKFVIYPMTN